MIVIGLTGSIGMGKTTVAGMLRKKGIAVHCSDECVRALIGPGGEAVAAVTAAFPEALDKKAKAIDRQVLGALVFGDVEKKERLEGILHPLVRDSQQKFLRDESRRGVAMAGLDIPLLFETGAETRLDYTLVVSAPAFIQKQRVMRRKGMTKEKFEAILASQMSDEDKRARADFIIPTGAGLAQTRRELDKAIATIKMKGPKHGSRLLPSHDVK